MNYIRSNAIRENWGKIGYVPSFDEQVDDIINNSDLSVWGKIEALRTLSHESGVKNKDVENWVITSDKYLKKFESNEEDEPHVYFIDEVTGRHYKKLFTPIHQFFSTLDDAINEIITETSKSHAWFQYLEHISQSDLNEFYFTVKKVYMKKDVRSISADYRYKDGKFEIIWLNLSDAEGICSEEERYFDYFLSDYCAPTNGFPFKAGDIVNCYQEDRVYVLSEVDYNEGVFKGFYFDEDDGILTESENVWLRRCDYLNIFDEDYQEENNNENFQKLKLIASCIKNEITANDIINKLKEDDSHVHLSIN